jgi:PAS domain-containing protein
LVCDNELPDAPIIYATDSFEELTGYSGSEIKGRNCRFLQNPPASAAVLMEDPEIVLRFQKYNEPLLSELRHRIAKGEEGQVKIVNYRKDGRPFFNILTVIPITFKDMDGSERKLIVGFQVDEKDIKGFLG